MRPTHQKVSAADVAALRRQAKALAFEQNDDEGDDAWRGGVRDWVDEYRLRNDGAPAVEWWETKTETELHERARALGLLG